MVSAGYEQIALALVKQCVRDTQVEVWHAEGRITQEEMREWMKEVVDKVFTVVTNLGNDQFATGLCSLASETFVMWDRPKIDVHLLEACLSESARQGF